jgi:hypothetical protein
MMVPVSALLNPGEAILVSRDSLTLILSLEGEEDAQRQVRGNSRSLESFME